MAKKQPQVIRAWIGVSAGKPAWYRGIDYYDGVLHTDLFRTRAAAKVCYDDVRRVTITVEPETREET